jgi:hypothetical protein
VIDVKEGGLSRRGLSRRGFVGGAGAIALSSALTGVANAIPGGKALELAEQKRPELIELLSDLIRIQSLSGETAAEAQAIVKTYSLRRSC